MLKIDDRSLKEWDTYKIAIKAHDNLGNLDPIPDKLRKLI
jgi:hypothetical protein